nr:MAG TPA: hypothetical protein [Caudoviricetes sp.]
MFKLWFKIQPYTICHLNNKRHHISCCLVAYTQS